MEKTNYMTLERFIEAQEYEYDMALREIRNGRKCNHWMWFIFPQIRGLGQSEMSIYFGIKDKDEAKDYLNDSILGERLQEITRELLKLNIDDPVQIFGSIDSMKLKSCMTLFNYVAPNITIFSDVLNKYYNGSYDQKTIYILEQLD